MGIEALSRGAAHATFVELDREALETIRANLQLTKLAGRATIERQDVFKYLARKSETKFDLIYVAPPQYREMWSKALLALDAEDFLTDKGIIVAQMHPKEYRDLELTNLDLVDQRKYGSTMLCFYGKRTINN